MGRHEHLRRRIPQRAVLRQLVRGEILAVFRLLHRQRTVERDLQRERHPGAQLVTAGCQRVEHMDGGVGILLLQLLQLALHRRLQRRDILGPQVAVSGHTHHKGDDAVLLGIHTADLSFPRILSCLHYTTAPFLRLYEKACRL